MADLGLEDKISVLFLLYLICKFIIINFVFKNQDKLFTMRNNSYSDFNLVRSQLANCPNFLSRFLSECYNHKQFPL